MSAQRTGKLLLLVFLGVVGGCPEPITPEKKEAEERGETPKAAAAAPETAKVLAVPQEALQEDATALKVKGDVVVEGWQKGTIQVDVTRSIEGDVQPITVARFQAPGPYTLFLPAGTEEVYLSAFVDLDGDGPTVLDPRGGYAENPLKLTGKTAEAPVEGINIVVDLTNVVKPPPSDAEPGKGAGDAAAQAEAPAADAAAPAPTPAAKAPAPTAPPPAAKPAPTPRPLVVPDAKGSAPGMLDPSQD